GLPGACVDTTGTTGSDDDGLGMNVATIAIVASTPNAATPTVADGCATLSHNFTPAPSAQITTSAIQFPPMCVPAMVAEAPYVDGKWFEIMMNKRGYVM